MKRQRKTFSGKDLAKAIRDQMQFDGKIGLWGLVATVLFVLMFPITAPADEFPSIDHQATRKHCGVCHIAYQPQMLPKRSWRALMDGIDKHFGETISLSLTVKTDITNYLATHAANHESPIGRSYLKDLMPESTPIRITEIPRFVGKHSDLPDRIWTRPRIAGKSDCGACHPAASDGIYDDDDIVIP